MKILIREEQFIKLLNEDIAGVVNRDNVTLNDIWNGYTTFKHGDMQSANNSPLKQIQQRLYDKFPKYAAEINFNPDNDFGDKTSKMIGKLFNTEFKDLTSVEIGIKTLEKLGFEKPEMLTLDEKIVAITLVMEKSSADEEEIKAISNVIRNRNKAGRGSIIDIVLKCGNQLCQFSGWDDYKPKRNDKELINRIMKEKRYMNKPSWDIAVKYAKLLLNNGNFGDNTDGATHYFNDYGKEDNKPWWTKTIDKKTKKLCWVDHELNKDFEHTFGRDTCTTWAKKPIR